MPTDTTPLDDKRLDLTLDCVHPITISLEDANLLLNDIAHDALADMLNEALDYIEGSGEDAILVITIKRA